MVNELTTGIYEFFLGTQFILLLYAIIIKSTKPNEERIDHILTAAFSTTLAWLNANMIINGNVNIVFSDGTYVPIQSIPVYYFLLSIAIISMILTVWLVVDYFRIKTESNEVFSALGGNL